VAALRAYDTFPNVLDLVTAGETFDDHVFHGLARLPRLGEELKTTAFDCAPGGGAVITAIAAARLGLRCCVMSALSTANVRALRAEGIRVTNVLEKGEAPALTVALSTASDRAFVTYNGVNDRLSARLLPAVVRARARHVHFALQPASCGQWVPVIDRLRWSGIGTSWDFGWSEPLSRDRDLWRLIESVDYVLVNRDEALLYARGRTLDAALRRWRGRARCVIVKLGPDGSRALSEADDAAMPAPRVRVVDTTGAGDAFNAGFLTARLRGADLRTALRLGNRLGALSTRRAGGIAGLPRVGKPR
jgi:sugar/nucleoside kinase (ribokinase family)